MSAALRIVKADDKQSTADRLRARIRNRDRLAKQLAVEDAAIAVDARRYADERGEFLRPTIGQLRRDLQP